MSFGVMILEKTTLHEIGLRIAQRRRELSLTQEKLAEMMDVSIQMISNLERGNKAIKIDNLIKLSSSLQVSTDYILTGKRPEMVNLPEKMCKLSERDYKIVDALVDALIEE